MNNSLMRRIIRTHPRLAESIAARGLAVVSALAPLATSVAARGLAVAATLVPLAASAQPAAPVQPAAAAAPSGALAAPPALTPRGDEVVLNFRDAEIESIANAFAHLIGRNLVVDPRVRGKLTLETARPVGRQQAFELFRIALRGLGFAYVDVGGIGRIVPEADGKVLASTVRGRRQPPHRPANRSSRRCSG